MKLRKFNGRPYMRLIVNVETETVRLIDLRRGQRTCRAEFIRQAIEEKMQRQKG